MKKKTYVKYQLGVVVAIPLTIGGYILDVIVRSNLRVRAGGGVVGYIFNKHYKSLPEKIDYNYLSPLNARTYMKHSDLKIRNGTWPIVGQIPNFDPNLWIMPHFHTCGTLGGYTRSKAVVYNELNPLEFKSQYTVDPKINLVPDALQGDLVFVEELEDMVKDDAHYPRYILRLSDDLELKRVLDYYERRESN